MIPGKVRPGNRTFFFKFVKAGDHSGKRSLTLSDFPEKVQQGYPTLQKKSGKVTGLFQKCLPKLPDFSKIIRQSSRSFWKK
jgi:hypothetical protein